MNWWHDYRDDDGNLITLISSCLRRYCRWLLVTNDPLFVCTANKNCTGAPPSPSEATIRRGLFEIAPGHSLFVKKKKQRCCQNGHVNSRSVLSARIIILFLNQGTASPYSLFSTAAAAADEQRGNYTSTVTEQPKLPNFDSPLYKVS